MTELISSPERTREILQAHGFTFKKSLGQNFLTNPGLLQDMVAAADLSAADQVIEIGPGIGALTELLAQKAGKVVALEIDQRLIPILADTLQAYPNVVVKNADILKVDLPALLAAEFDVTKPIKVLANLPYYITTPILLKLVQAQVDLAQIIVMMQYEVAERIVATPGHKAYGSLTLAIAMNMQAQIVTKVPKSAFIPQPKVDSAIVSLTPLTTEIIPKAEKAQFNRFIQIVFKQRRKRLLNNLLSFFGKTPATKTTMTAAITSLGVTVDVRAEALSLGQLEALFRFILKNQYKI